jgi:hypothetical protein
LNGSDTCRHGDALVIIAVGSERLFPSGPEWLFWVGLSAGLMLLFGIFRIAAWALFGLQPQGLLSQGTAAAAATAATYVAMTPVIRRAFKEIVLRDGRRA